MAHYMLGAGYPTDQPDDLRKVAELVVGKKLLANTVQVDT